MSVVLWNRNADEGLCDVMFVVHFSETDSPRDPVTSRDLTHRGRGRQRQSRQGPGRLHQQPPTDEGSGRR